MKKRQTNSKLLLYFRRVYRTLIELCTWNTSFRKRRLVVRKEKKHMEGLEPELAAVGVVIELIVSKSIIVVFFEEQ